MTNREARIVANEALFRALNERLVDILEDLDDTFRSADVFCECGNDECEEKITVPRDVYETVRSDPTHFLVTIGHVIPEVESVIDHRAGFEIVEKHEEEAPLARATDPRS